MRNSGAPGCSSLRSFKRVQRLTRHLRTCASPCICNTMSRFEILNTDSATNRSICMIAADDIAGIQYPETLPSLHFVALVALDATGLTNERIAALARDLLARGCVWFLCFGPDCLRVHDIIDAESEAFNRGPNDAPWTMTTWHSDESFDDVVWQFLNTTALPDCFFDTTRTALVLIVGMAAQVTRTVQIMKDLSAFNSQWARE